jgi:Cellulase (glycosyl hydrolase family 5)
MSLRPFGTLALFVMLLTAVACGGGDDAPAETGAKQERTTTVAERVPDTCARLSVRDGRISDPDGKPVALRGVNVFAQSVDGAGVSAEDLEEIRAAGFNVVRVVDYWDVLEPAAPKGGKRQYDERAFEALDATIAAAGKAGLYVVLDPVHLFNMSPAYGGRGVPAWVYEGRIPDVARARGEVATDPVVRRHMDALLRKLAARYADDPVVAAIDPVNEPPPEDTAAIVSWYAHMVDVIRAEARDMLVVVEPRFGDHDMRTVDLTPLSDKGGLVLSPHFYYAGGAGDGYAAGGVKNGRYVFDGKTGYAQRAPDELRQHLEPAVTAARQAGMALWIGEFGINRQAPGAAQYVADTTKLFAQAGAGWAYWVWKSMDGFTLIRQGGEISPLLEPLSAAARNARSPAGRPLRCRPR